jgi:hypothetical protein
MPPADDRARASPRRTRRRALLATLLALGLAAGGFWIAPSLLTPIAAARLSALTGADVRIGWISWNPMVGRAVLHRVAIAPTTDAPPTVTVQAATVDVAVRRWLQGERAFDAVVLRRPWVALQRTAAGDFNVATLFSSIGTAPAPSPSASEPTDMGPPTPIRIGLFRIMNGSIEFRDETTRPALETSLYLDDASARDLVLASDGSAGLAFHVESHLENAPLTLDVSYDTAAGASHLAAKLVAQDASLARALLYVPLGWQRTSGTMDATLRYERRVENNRLTRHTVQADLAIHDLALTEPWAAEPMLQAKKVRVPTLVVDLVKQRTDLGAIEVADYRAIIVRDDERLHVPLVSGSADATRSTWRTALDRVELGAGVAVLRRVFATPETTVALRSGIVRLPPNEVTFGFAGALAGGTLTLDGSARGDTTALSFAFENLDLAATAPLVGSPLGFTKGRIGGTIGLVMAPTGATLRGTLSSTDATSTPTPAHPEEVVAWQRLDATIAEGTLDPLRLTLSRARVVWPYLMVHRRADGVFPLTSTSSVSPVAAPAAAAAAAPWLRLDHLDVEGGRIEFWDSTLPQPYGIDFTDLAGAADGMTLAPLSVAQLTMRGALDELSPVTLTGRIDPAVTTLDLHVERLLLPPLNPYLAPALGYEVKTGLAQIASDVRLQGGKLTADTALVLSRFAMRAAGTDAVAGRIGTPLSVALALMKDTRGDIRLQLPIEGDVAANEYRVGSLLREALGTALLGTLRAPLGFLRGIFHKDEGEQFELRPVPFAAGSAELGPDGEKRIEELARLLERQAALRARLIPAPSRVDLDALVAAGTARPVDALAQLARDRVAAVHDRLTRDRGVDPKRVAVESSAPVEPDIEGEPGVDVQLRTAED